MSTRFATVLRDITPSDNGVLPQEGTNLGGSSGSDKHPAPRRLERLRLLNRNIFLYGPPGVGKHTLLARLDEEDRTEGKVRQAVDLRSAPNLNPADIWKPTEGLTIANADDPAVQLNDLYPALSANLPGPRNTPPFSISEEHPLRVSSVDSVRFAASLPKKLAQGIERIFPAVRIYPLSYRECEGLSAHGIEFSTDTTPSTFFPGADEQTLLSRMLAGGLPSIQGLTSDERNRRWHVYVEELVPLLGRGDRQLGVSAVALLRTLANRPGAPVDCKELSRSLGFTPRQTKLAFRRCVELSLIEPVYPVDATAFSESLPFFFDTGFLTYLMGLRSETELRAHPAFTAVFAHFIASEIRKSRAYGPTGDRTGFVFEAVNSNDADFDVRFPYRLSFLPGDPEILRRPKVSLPLHLSAWVATLK